MAELVLSAVLPVLFEKLTSHELLKFATQEGVSSNLKNWEKTLKLINALLVDAEEKQLTNGAVKIWLEELQDLAFDAEDILDECATEALRRKLKIEEHQATTSRARKLIPACFIGCTSSALWSDRFSMRSKIDGITSRLQDLCKQRTELGLVEISGGRSTASSQRPATTCLPTEPAVYGRDEDKDKILEMVLTHEPGQANFGVIPIVGMGGIGKTTLARQVYNDEKVEHFYPKAWVCVSDDFDVLRISKAILELITSSSCDKNELNAVQNQLKDALNGQKFLIVLDDVWSENYDLWESLKAPLMAGAVGSKIIMTTRSTRVATTIRPREREVYDLKGLSDDDCWAMFVAHAFYDRGTNELWNLDVIRDQVVQKCKGLPLAAKTLGGILYHKKTEDEWIDILNSQMWDLEDTILPVLRLKGLIQKSSDGEQLEILGGKYFHDLLSRSIFQKSSSNTSKFIMHDLVNDLAVKISGKLSFRLEDEMQSKISEKTRYTSYLRHRYNDKSKFEVLNDARHLRTHLTVPPINDMYEVSYISNIVVSNLFSNFKKLRVLSLQGYHIDEVPDSIADLRLLRHLNLSRSYIRSLPKSINSLCNLQTLLLRNCWNFLKWPSSMGNLVNLHHLDIFGAHLVKEMPTGIRKWVCLRTLSNFIVGKDSRSNLEDLEDLKLLCGELHISRLQNVSNFQLGEKMVLTNKKNLKVLSLDWRSRFDESNDEEIESSDEEMDKRLLDILRPHQNLEKLMIKCYGGKTFSSWVGDSSFFRMTVVKLKDCEKCTSLPSLGLLDSLKSLTIKGMKGLKSIDSTFYGQCCSHPFKSLEILHFKNLEECESWEPVKENESFPRLQKLSIVNCPKLLGRLPNKLVSLKKLVILGCEQLVVLLSNMPKLCELEIDECKKFVCTSSAFLESLEYMSFSNISDFGDLSRQKLKKVQNLKIEGCNELIELWQNEIFLEKSLQGLPSLNSLKKLNFSKCNTLTTLLEGIKQKNVLVEELAIESCDSLNFIFRGQLPPSLKKLHVEKCEKLQYLLGDNEDSSSSLSSATFSVALKEVNATTSHLEDLYIGECSSLTCLPSIDQLSLTSLHISDCPKLTTLSLTGHLPVALKHLKIHKCSELATLLPKGHFPETLETLEIFRCEKLESTVEKFHNNKALCTIHICECQNLKSLPEGLETLSNLESLTMFDCGGLASFPKGGFPNSNFRVGIHRCKMLEALPSGIHTLSSLQIIYCPNMSLHEEDLLTKLTYLAIKCLKQYKVLIERGFHNFTSLIKLHIHGGGQDGDSIQEMDMEITLAPTLTNLWIGHFPKLKCLPFKHFEDLTSLKSLVIGYCPELTSLPSILPSSVMELVIKECPSLKEACKRDKGKEWPKLVDIPRVDIDQIFSRYRDD